MDIRPIHDDDDHAWALAEIARYFEHEPERGSADGDRFEVLTELIAAYEARRFPMTGLDPVDALAAFMESADKSQKDLAALFGSAPRASEILSRKRTLTIEMIHALHREWGVPADLLIVPYARAA